MRGTVEAALELKVQAEIVAVGRCQYPAAAVAVVRAQAVNAAISAGAGSASGDGVDGGNSAGALDAAEKRLRHFGGGAEAVIAAEASGVSHATSS